MENIKKQQSLNITTPYTNTTTTKKKRKRNKNKKKNKIIEQKPSTPTEKVYTCKYCNYDYDEPVIYTRKEFSKHIKTNKATVPNFPF